LIDPARFRHKELRKLFEGQPSKIDARWRRKIERALAQLNVIVSPGELTHFGCHELSGDRSGCHALHISPSWRLTFRWDDRAPHEIDLEDDHG
jgi:plasmid maintenance system killer protein